MPQTTIPAVYMRGGTSKGLFFHAADLPPAGRLRDRLLLAAIGSPDPYGRQIDGLGGATSSTSKVVVMAPSARPDCDADYLFGHVAIREALIDWSGNCGNLSCAAGVFAIEQGLLRASAQATTPVRIWQANLGQRIVVHVPTDDEGRVRVRGDYRMAGVPGSGAPIRIDFLQPGGAPDGAVLPTGHVRDTLDVAGVGRIECSLVRAGNATVFIDAATLGLRGCELPAQVDAREDLLARVEAIRRQASLVMGMTRSRSEAAARQATPKLAFVGPAQDYLTTQGEALPASGMDLCARIFSMGRLHHAYTGTGAIATAVAAAIPGSIVAGYCRGAATTTGLRIGHSAGIIDCTAEVSETGGGWRASKASLTRTARTLMRGEVVIEA